MTATSAAAAAATSLLSFPTPVQCATPFRATLTHDAHSISPPPLVAAKQPLPRRPTVGTTSALATMLRRNHMAPCLWDDDDDDKDNERFSADPATDNTDDDGVEETTNPVAVFCSTTTTAAPLPRTLCRRYSAADDHDLARLSSLSVMERRRHR